MEFLKEWNRLVEAIKEGFPEFEVVKGRYGVNAIPTHTPFCSVYIKINSYSLFESGGNKPSVLSVELFIATKPTLEQSDAIAESISKALEICEYLSENEICYFEKPPDVDGVYSDIPVVLVEGWKYVS